MSHLQMIGICKAFPGVVALDHADLSVAAGEVMALIGANGAGKSTLMNVLGGIVERDTGEITIDGRAVALRSPIESHYAGIAFVQQELNSLPTMTIAENIFIDAFPKRHGVIDYTTCNSRSRELLERLGSNLDPTMLVGELNIGDRQIVEIARALRRDPKLMIFDEPTSSLSVRERKRLFDVIFGLKASGVAVIYITHFIDEIFSVSDKITIMRNGRSVYTGSIGSLTERDVVHHMLGGKEHEASLQARRVTAPTVLLRAEGLSNRSLDKVSLDLRAGEVVGIWGLLGSGRTELLRAMLGLDPIDGGTLSWNDDGTMSDISPSALYARAGFVSEDRRGEGLFLPMSTSDNIVMPHLSGVSRFGLISSQTQRRASEKMINRLGIKVSSQDQRVATLSGGNQQKVVFARWLATAPRVLFLDEPTRGLDVAAKTEILRLVSELADSGVGVLLVSSELEELTRICDRYLVMVRGRIVAELPRAASRNKLLDALSTRRQEDAA